MTLTLNRPWSNKRTAHRLIILDICAELCENPTRGKNIQRTQKLLYDCITYPLNIFLTPGQGQGDTLRSNPLSCPLFIF